MTVYPIIMKYQIDDSIRAAKTRYPFWYDAGMILFYAEQELEVGYRFKLKAPNSYRIGRHIYEIAYVGQMVKTGGREYLIKRLRELMAA